MKAILSGGGHGDQTKELEAKFAKLLDKSKSLLYIPLAIDSKKHPYDECLKWLKSTMDNLGISSYEMITEETIDTLKCKSPNFFAGIYIGGGNTPYLLRKIKETCLWDFLKSALNENIPIYGGSAGAAIFGKTIIPALYHDKNEVGIKDLNGFDILKGIDITCHYSEKEKQNVQNVIRENNIKKLIALTESNGLFVTDNSIELIGQEMGFIFREHKWQTISPNKKIEF